MDRHSDYLIFALSRIPHARGDGPVTHQVPDITSMYSPRTWGWTARSPKVFIDQEVFPTHVGMDRLLDVWPESEEGIPHARGDGPRIEELEEEVKRYSPRTWGWTG